MPNHDSPRAATEQDNGGVPSEGNLEHIFNHIKSQEKMDPLLCSEVGTVYDTAVKGSGGGCAVM